MNKTTQTKETKKDEPITFWEVVLCIAVCVFFTFFFTWGVISAGGFVIEKLSKEDDGLCSLRNSCRFIPVYEDEKGKGTFTPIGYVEDENVVIQEELEAYFLVRAQDECKEEGGEWNSGKYATDGCTLDGKGFDYQNHILEGFDEYKSLKRVKEICSRNGGELIVAPSTAGAAKVVRRNGIFNFVTQTTCFIGDKEYLLKDGRLLREDELK